MTAFYLDTSSVVKRFVSETGSAWTINLFKPASGNRLYISRLTLVEVAAAVTRRKNENSLTVAQADKAIKRFERGLSGRYVIVEVRPAIIGEAMRLAKTHGLRGFDATQLASALFANQQRLEVGTTALTFVCADNKLSRAAAAEDLSVENPNSHP